MSIPVDREKRELEKEHKSKHRKLKGTASKIIIGLTAMMILIPFLYLLGFLTSDRIFILPFQVCALEMAIAFVLAFLLMPSGETSALENVPWYDFILMLMGVVPCIYVFITYPVKMGMPVIEGVHEYILGIFLLIATLEAGRRAVGFMMVVLALFFIAYPMFSHLLPGPLLSRHFPFSTVVERLFFSEVGIFGALIKIVFDTLWPFLLFAAFLRITGGGQFFLDLALAVAGRFRGGAGKAVVIASALMGTVTGSAVADVAAVGSVTIPMMKAQGYPNHFAGGLAACAATGAHLVPPVLGTVAFVMADILEISYWQVCVAAIIPGLLYYLTLFMVVDFEALKKQFKPLSPEQLPSFRRTIVAGGHFLLPILCLIYFLGVMSYRPERSCLYALFCLFIVTTFRKATRLNWQKFFEGIKEGALLMVDLAVILAVVTPMVTSIDMTGVGVNMSAAITDLAGGNLFVLLMLAGAVCYFLGLALPTVTSYLLLALLVAPAVVKAGVPPLAAHLFIVYITLTDTITPPLAPGAFVAAGIAGAPFMKTAFTSMYLGIAILIIPFYFAYSPELLLVGTKFGGGVALSFVTALMGAVCLAAAVAGYFVSRAGIIERLLLFGAALAFIGASWKMDILAIVLVSAIGLWQILKRRLFALNKESTAQ